MIFERFPLQLRIPGHLFSGRARLLLPAGIFLVLFAVLAVPVRGGDPPLELELSLSRDRIRPGNVLEFRLVFRNLSEEKRHVFLDGAYAAYLFEVRDASGVPAETERTAVYGLMWSPDGYKLLEPGGEYVWKIKADVIRKGCVGLDFGDSVIEVPRSGEYSVRAVYAGWDGLTTDQKGEQVKISRKLKLENVFTGKLVSRPVRLRVRR